MKWEDYKPIPVRHEVYEQTNIECPMCGQLLKKRIDIVLTLNPPQYQYECKCGWVGFNY